MKTYKKKKEELIFYKEINSLLINLKEIEKEYFSNQNQDNINPQDENENLKYVDKKKKLECQKRCLKYILNNLEKNYNYNFVSHEELKDKTIEEKKCIINEEISNNIIELYLSKKFYLCYNLWRKYDFQLLLGISEEKNFDMLNYLNKLRDRYDMRGSLIDRIKKINTNNDINENKKTNIMNQSYSHKLNTYNNSNFRQNNQISNGEIYNLKVSENEQKLQALKNKINKKK